MGLGRICLLLNECAEPRRKATSSMSASFLEAAATRVSSTPSSTKRRREVPKGPPVQEASELASRQAELVEFDAVVARVRASAPGCVSLRLSVIPRGPTPQEPCLDLATLHKRFETLRDGQVSAEEVRLAPMRLVHRQRLGRLLQFLGLRSPCGGVTEAVLKRGLLEPCLSGASRLGDGWALGDSVSVTGLVERSKGRLSILARRLTVVETWSELFGPRALFRDDAVNGLPSRLESGSMLAQIGSAHAGRLSGELLLRALSLTTLTVLTAS